MTCDTGIPGAVSHVHLIPETVWGTTPGSPTRTLLPVMDIPISFEMQGRQSDAFVGTVDGVHYRNSKGNPKGTLTAALYGFQRATATISVAEVLLRWMIPATFDNTTLCDMPSMTIEVAEGDNSSNRKWTGVRVGQFTISASETDPQIKVQATVEGKDEAALATAATVPTDLNKLIDMDFSDVVLTIGGTEVTIKGFTLSVDYGMTVEFNNSRRPEVMVVTKRDVKLTLDMNKIDDTYDVLMRNDLENEYEIVLEMRGSHNGTGATGTDTVVTITLGRAILTKASTTLARGALNKQPLEFVCLKPMTSDPTIDLAFTEE